MRALLPLVLLLFALPLAAATGGQPGSPNGTRVVVYCDDSGGCPGVAVGNRDGDCHTTGPVGPCFYTDGGRGVGVWTFVALCGDPYCVDVRAWRDHAGVGEDYCGIRVRAATNLRTDEQCVDDRHL